MTNATRRGRRIIDSIRAAQRPSTPAEIAWRFNSRKAAELAIADRQAKYPTLTVENFDEAGRYQQERIDYYMQQLGG